MAFCKNVQVYQRLILNINAVNKVSLPLSTRTDTALAIGNNPDIVTKAKINSDIATNEG